MKRAAAICQGGPLDGQVFSVALGPDGPEKIEGLTAATHIDPGGGLPGVDRSYEAAATVEIDLGTETIGGQEFPTATAREHRPDRSLHLYRLDKMFDPVPDAAYVYREV